MDGVMPTIGAPDRIGAADIARLGAQTVVAAFAIGGADRVYWGEIDDIEAHGADGRQSANHVIECTCRVGSSGNAARKELIPAREGGPRSLNVDGNQRFVLNPKPALVGIGHGTARSLR